MRQRSHHLTLPQIDSGLKEFLVQNAVQRHLLGLKGVLQRIFFISTNERLMYKFYKNCNYFIFK